MSNFQLVDATTFKKSDDRSNVAVRKAFSGVRKAVNMESRTVDFVVSTGAVDRDGDTISPQGFLLDNYRKNPVVLFGHDQHQPPVGKAVSIEADTKSLRSRAEFAPREVYTFSDTIFQLVANDYLNAVSVGFIPREYKFVDEDRGGMFMPMDITSADLMEYSVVPVPSNPEALIDARSKGIDTDPLRVWAEQVLDCGAPQSKEANQLWQVLRKTQGLILSLDRQTDLARKNLARTKVAPEDAEEGRFYEWDSSGGTAKGRADRVVTEGSIDVPDSDFTIDASEDDPAVLLTVYQESGDGYLPSDTQVGHRASELRAIDPLPEPSEETDGMKPEEQRAAEPVTKPEVPADGPAPGESAVQTLMFDQSVWSRGEAEQWVRDHDYRLDGFADESGEYRFRQFNPDNCASESFGTLTDDFPEGLRAVVCRGAEEQQRATKATDFPTEGDDREVMLENSQYDEFDREFAEMVDEQYPEVWDAGGTNDADRAFRMWGRARNGSSSDAVKEWIRTREAWAARHFQDGGQFGEDDAPSPNLSNIAGVVAQMKWGVVGTLGMDGMKAVINQVIEKRENGDEDEERSARLRSMALRARRAKVLTP